MASVSLAVLSLPSSCSSSSTTTVSCSRLTSISLPCFRARQSGASRRSIVMHAVPSESATLDQCRGIIAEQLGIDASTVKPESKFSDLGADSLDTVEIVMALEEKFKIQVEQEGAEKIVTVKDASDVIHKLVSQKHA